MKHSQLLPYALFTVALAIGLSFARSPVQRSSFPTNVGGQTSTGALVPILVDSFGVVATAAASSGNVSSNITQLSGTAVSTATFGTGAALVVGFQTGSISTAPVGTLAINGAAIATNRLGTLDAVARSNYPTAYTTGRDSALTTDLSGVAWTGNLPVGLTTYVASSTGLTLATNPTDVAVLPGNATNTVIVTGVTASCTQTTASAVDIFLIKRSAADTAGSSTAMTIVPMDSGNGAAVSAPLAYTANPTVGAAVGAVDKQKLTIVAPATTTIEDTYRWKPGMGQSVVLRGTAQQLAIHFNGQTISGAACHLTYSWIETTGL